jgi:hypothetical protein
MKKNLNTIFYWVVIVGLLLGCIMIFTTKVEKVKPSTSYKYKIYTQKAIYLTNEIDCHGGGIIGFYNSNGEYVLIQ